MVSVILKILTSLKLSIFFSSFLLFTAAKVWGNSGESNQQLEWSSGTKSKSKTNSVRPFVVGPQRYDWDSEEYKKGGHLFPSDVLLDAASLQIAGTPLSGQTRSLSFRGSPSHLTQVYWNGVAVNDWLSPTAAAEAQDGTQEFSTRVKVYRGPQTLLYSSNAVGGVVDYSLDEDDSFIVLQRTSNSISRGALEKHFHSPITEGNSERIKTRFSLGLSHLDSFGQSSISPSAIQPTPRTEDLERDRWIQNSRSIAGELEFNESRLRLSKLHWLYSEFERQSDDDQTQLDDPNSKTQRKRKLYRLGADFSLPNSIAVEMDFSAQVNQIEFENEPDSQSSLRSLSRNEGQHQRSRFFLSRELKILKGHLNLQGGVESTEEAGTFFERSSSGSQFYEPQREKLGGVTVGEYEFGNQRISLGLRQEGSRGTAFPLSHQVMYEHHLKGGWSPYIAFAQGHHDPTLFQLYSAYGNKELAVEKHATREIGVQWSKAQGTNQTLFDLSLFRNESEDLVEFDLTSLRYQNLRRVKSEGLESSFEIHREDHRLRLSHFRGQSLNLDTGLQRLRQPKESTRLRWEYFILPQWVQTVTLQHWGPKDDYVRGQVGPRPSMTHLNLGHSYEWQTWELLFRVENLLGSGQEDVFGYTQPGRVYILGIRSEL